MIKTKTRILESFASKGIEIFRRISRPWMAIQKMWYQESWKEKGLGKGTICWNSLTFSVLRRIRFFSIGKYSFLAYAVGEYSLLA